MRRETLVNVFPSDDDDSRLVIAIEHSEDGENRLVLRQETRSDAVGWFVQSCVEVLPEQVTGLKASLSGRSISTVAPKPQRLQPSRHILSFAEVAAARAS